MRCGALLRRRWHQLLLGPPAQPQLQLGAARRAASSAAASDDGGNEVINAATQQPPTSDSWMVFQTPAGKRTASESLALASVLTLSSCIACCVCARSEESMGAAARPGGTTASRGTRLDHGFEGDRGTVAAGVGTGAQAPACAHHSSAEASRRQPSDTALRLQGGRGPPRIGTETVQLPKYRHHYRPLCTARRAGASWQTVEGLAAADSNNCSSCSAYHVN
eukprot:scaffold1419_cov410-Prasinococcus_capsulatus_cf.AAC.16